MEQSYVEKIQLHTDSISEMLFSLQRIGANEVYSKLSKEYGISKEEDIEDWVLEVLKLIDEPMKELLDFYFNDDGFFGLGLAFIVNELQDQKMFEHFISKIEKMSPEEMCHYLLLYGCEDNRSKELNFFQSIQQEAKIFDLIEEHFTVSTTGKWRVFKILSKPKVVKEEVLSLLNYYYNTFYKQKESQVTELITQQIQLQEEALKKAFIHSVRPILSKEMETDLFHNKKTLQVLVSYFAEWGSYFNFEEGGLIIGYRYPELVRILGSGNQGLLSRLNVLKVLADDTRLKILLQMNQGPKYLTEIAGTLGFSTPAVKYHLEKFLSVSLIQIDKAENRIYYTLNKDTLEELISELRHSFNLK